MHSCIARRLLEISDDAFSSLDACDYETRLAREGRIEEAVPDRQLKEHYLAAAENQVGQTVFVHSMYQDGNGYIQSM